jgi:hypothetical protein
MPKSHVLITTGFRAGAATAVRPGNNAEAETPAPNIALSFKK